MRRALTFFRHPIFVLTAALALVACGGGGGGGGASNTPTTATGVFKDSNVVGMNYTSGAQSGVTTSNGQFTYMTGQTVSFSVGGVSLGTVNGKSVITPIDLVPNGSSTSTEVLNRVRFLMMLDMDGNPANGIVISPAVQAIAANWAAVDFSTADLPTALTSHMSDAASVDGTAHALPSAAAAQAHIESTVLCVRAGGYRGTFGGSSSGPFGVLVDAGTGLLSGYAYVTASGGLLSLTGTTAISFDQSSTFITGDASSGATFSGQFNGADNISGSWQLAPDSGTFAGSRIGGVSNAVHRFTGRFMGNASGIFTFDVDAADNVSGVAYTVRADDGTTNELSTFTGTVNGTLLAASVTNNGVVETTITGILNRTSGTLVGSWSDVGGGANGTFTGSGCKLN